MKSLTFLIVAALAITSVMCGTVQTEIKQLSTNLAQDNEQAQWGS